MLKRYSESRAAVPRVNKLVANRDHNVAATWRGTTDTVVQLANKTPPRPVQSRVSPHKNCTLTVYKSLKT
jgi:hypothetical protein